jgi:hypothetical protein
MRVKEATPLLLQYIPKDLLMGERSRGGAIWALGWLNAGVPDKALGDALMARILDMSPIPFPELVIVKQHSAIALTRMKAVDYAPTLRQIIETRTPHSKFGLAVRWAVKEMTGEDFPDPSPQFIPQGVWFLEPLPPNERQ